jgi:hypothetical protein
VRQKRIPSSIVAVKYQNMILTVAYSTLAGAAGNLDDGSAMSANFSLLISFDTYRYSYMSK